jgi:hypothetical protein
MSRADVTGNAVACFNGKQAFFRGVSEMTNRNSCKKNLGMAGVICALSYAGTSQAINQGEPGEAVLVPYALYDSVNGVNTMVGLTIPSTLGIDPNQTERGGGDFTGSGFTSAPQEGATNCDLNGAPDNTGATGAIDWWFFDATGAIQAQGQMYTGCDDFVAFDWGSKVNSSGIGALDGMPGFLIFGNDSATFGSFDPYFAIYADAMIIRGTWESAAYIPTLPMANIGNSLPLRQGYTEIVYTGGQPSSYSPLTSGMGLDNDDGAANDTVYFDTRYFLDPILNASTEIVVWLDQNCRGGADGCDRQHVPVRTYDTDRSYLAGEFNLSKMLNVVDPSTLARPGNALSGFVRVAMPEVSDSNAAGREGPDHAGVAFSLIRFSSPGNAQQAQTTLAHERGVK